MRCDMLQSHTHRVPLPLPLLLPLSPYLCPTGMSTPYPILGLGALNPEPHCSCPQGAITPC